VVGGVGSAVAVRRNGVSFVVWLRERVSIDDVADEVAAALAVALRPSDERGLQDDYVGEVAGMELWLRICDPATEDGPHRIALLGGPAHTLDEDAVWVDLGPYVAELLTVRTGRRWSAGAA
jgi:hypothetical protein